LAITLDDNGLLQADATILAGLLILLTLLSFKAPKVEEPEKPINSIVEKKTASSDGSNDWWYSVAKDLIKGFERQVEQSEFKETQRRIKNTLSIATIGIIPFSVSAFFLFWGLWTYWAPKSLWTYWQDGRWLLDLHF
jgi:hypothetical protein